VTDEITEEAPPARGMNRDEEQMADAIYAAIMHASRYSERSLQAGEFRVGISDLGYCSERTRRMLGQEVPEDSDELAAFIGTAVGDHTEQALAAVWDDAILKSEVSVVLEGDGGTYQITGHPDIVRSEHGLVVDVKTARGLAVPRRTGPSQSQQFQRHLYAKGAWEAGLFGYMGLEDVQVANAWIDRAADHHEIHVAMEPFNPDVVTAATQWLDDVVYAFLHDETARKEPPRQVCEATCGFFGTCRALETDVSGLITDETTLIAVDLYQEGLALEKRGRQLKDQANAALVGVSGSTGEFSVRWTHVNGTRVEYDRNSYDRLIISKLKGPR